ncbi:MAG TPA: tripartite tricarboxylate transporter TctB family protein [Candidatus Limnocylindria bacterium]|nr:tripartite tricarboxylate transporter TctB family protein [Candidatus Limnocylindria bacterium]
MPEKHTAPDAPDIPVVAPELDSEAEHGRDAYGFEVVDDSKTAHHDFLTSLILIGVSVGVIIESLGYWRRQRVVFHQSAGFMPIIIASGLLVMSLRLLREALKHDTVRNFLRRVWRGFVGFVRSRTVHRALVGLAIFGAYVFYALGRMEFWLASFIALAAVLVFVRFDRKWQTTLKMVLIAALCVAGIVGLFQYAFEVPMP